MASLHERVVIVTGASSGIGRDLAIALAERGATVVGAARNEERLRSLADEHGTDVIVTDVAQSADRERLIDVALERHGRIDALVNNAGIGLNVDVADMTEDQITSQVAVNLTALMDLTRRALPGMLARGRGDVVNVASMAGYVAAPPFSVYAATKHGVVGFTNGLRRELRGSGVHAHLIAPGPVRTEWARRAAGYAPEAGAAEQPDEFGVSPRRVTDAMLGCLGSSRSRVIAVPRLLGLARIAEAPLIRLFTDRFARSAASGFYH